MLAGAVALSVLAPAGVAAAAGNGSDITSPNFIAQAESAQQHGQKLTQKQRAAIAIRWAYKHIGDRYALGATGAHRWDCSAFVGAAWRAAGIKLPRTTNRIYGSNWRHVSWNSLQPGDILEFYGQSHVGIYVGNGYMIHESASHGRAIKAKLVYPGYSFRNYFNGAIRPGN